MQCGFDSYSIHRNKPKKIHFENIHLGNQSLKDVGDIFQKKSPQAKRKQPSLLFTYSTILTSLNIYHKCTNGNILQLLATFGNI